MYIDSKTMSQRKAVKQIKKAPVHQQAHRRIVGKGAYSMEETRKRTKHARRVAKSKGDYEPSFGRNLLTEGGSMLGGIFGMPGLGKSAGSALSNIFGLGDYEVKENVFMHGRLPEVTNIPSGGGTVIRFQEYLADVYTTANVGAPDQFHIQSYDINPAQENTFPWLSQLAGNFEQYYIEGLIFEFRSTSANALNSTNTALGSVMMATQYDVSDPIFRSKAEMLNYEFSNSTKPSANCLHMIECAPSQTVLSGLYTLSGAIPSGTDPRMFNLGRFSIATVGFQAANVNIGELHVTYQVRLCKPKLYGALGFFNDWAIMTNSSYSNAVPWNSTDSTWGYNGANSFSPLMQAGTLVLPASSVIKTYRIEAFWSGTAVNVVFPAITVANCTLNVANGQNGPVGGTSNSATALTTISVTTLGNSRPASISMGGLGVLPSAGNLCIVRVIQVPQNAPF
tara:strand:+ start:1213 stop:2568 length:1356 start_codon:yes stop_codon:yes gene_type:complete